MVVVVVAAEVVISADEVKVDRSPGMGEFVPRPDIPRSSGVG